MSIEKEIKSDWMVVVLEAADKARNAACTHAGKKDITTSKDGTRNLYCPSCQMHWYAGREWTKSEWSEYVEDFWENFEDYVPSNPNKASKKNPFLP